MPDGAPPGGKKVLGVPRNYLLAGGTAFAIGLVYMWWKRHNAAGSSSSTTVITGSVSSNTGISGAMLNAILKDWQEHPETSSTSTGKKTTKTTSKTTTPPGKKKTTATGGAPKGGPPGKTKGGKLVNNTIGTTYKEITVKKGQTLDEIAKEYGITPAELAHANVYVKGEAASSKVGQTLGTGAGLKTGQKLRVPVSDKK
jgi:LysM repeat protein